MDEILSITKAPSQKKRKLEQRKDQPKPMFRVTEKTPWGEKGVWVIPEPIERVEETEEQKMAREAFQKEAEDSQAHDREIMDAWWETCLKTNEDGTYVFEAEVVAKAHNDLSVFKGKRKLSAWDVVKIRTKYGLPASLCHKPKSVFSRGSGRKKQSYVVDYTGAWRKVNE